MKQKSINKIFPILLVLALLTPIALQFSHSFEYHQISSHQKHGVNQTINTLDCDVFHHLFSVKTTLQFSHYSIFNEVFTRKIINDFTAVYVKNNQNLIDTRGSPLLIV